MDNQQVVAYLDLLAFSSYVRENTEDALLTFNNYKTILEIKITDALRQPLDSHSDPILKDFATRRSINSFKHFLPFSDSIFITSDDPNLFLKQLSFFVLNCFRFTSKQYENPDDASNPIKVSNIFNENLPEENWYPTLFRGGIAFGEVKPIELLGIVNGSPQIIANLAGKAVVKAVNHESKVKGPRIVFEKDLFNELDKSTKIYVNEIEGKGLYELLWPAFYYDTLNMKFDVNEFYELFLPAVNLWKANNHTPHSEQYFNFVELVVTSTLKIFDANGLKGIVISKVSEVIREVGLEHKTTQLLKSFKE